MDTSHQLDELDREERAEFAAFVRTWWPFLGAVLLGASWVSFVIVGYLAHLAAPFVEAVMSSWL